MKRYLCVLIILMLCNACEYPDKPEIIGSVDMKSAVTFIDAEVIDYSTVKLAGTLEKYYLGDFDHSSVGFMYKRASFKNDINDMYVVCNFSDGRIESVITGLSPNTKYFYCVFLKDKHERYFYGANYEFKTPDVKFEFLEVVPSNNGAEIIVGCDYASFSKGDYKVYVRISEDEKLFGNIMFSQEVECKYLSQNKFEANVTGLKPNTQYYFKAYFENESSVYQSEQSTLTTNKD